MFDLDFSEGDGQSKSAFLQKRIDTRNMNNVVAALPAVFDAAALSSLDKQKLVVLVQPRQSGSCLRTCLHLPAGP